MFFKSLAIALLAGLSINLSAFAQSSSTGSTKATASISSSCQISAQNVNFGQLNPGATTVTASSNMNLFCTKGSTYTIGLAYGGIYGQGGTPTGTYWKEMGCSGSPGSLAGAPGCFNNGTWYFEYNASNTKISQQELTWTAGQTPATVNSNTVYQSGGTGIGAIYSVVNSSYAYGHMVGVMSGDVIQYKITVPGNDNEVWNAGNYTYGNTGTGANQTFPIKATATLSGYPTPDTYMDTVTAIVSY